MVDVICDTSFVIVLASKPVRGMEELEAKLGKLNFIIPTIVIDELKKLALTVGVKRTKQAKLAMDLISRFKTIELDGSAADDLITEYASKNHCIAATIDDSLKNRLLRNGIRVITLSHDRLTIV